MAKVWLPVHFPWALSWLWNDIPSAILVGELSVQLGRLLRLERIPFAIERAWQNRNKEA